MVYIVTEPGVLPDKRRRQENNVIIFNFNISIVKTLLKLILKSLFNYIFLISLQNEIGIVRGKNYRKNQKHRERKRAQESTFMEIVSFINTFKK